MQRNHLRPVENKALEKENVFVILRMDVINDNTGDSYWSKTSGWVPLYGATRFFEEEKFKFVLPEGGRWVNLTEMTEAMERSMNNHPTRWVEKPGLRLIEDASSIQHPEHE